MKLKILVASAALLVATFAADPSYAYRGYVDREVYMRAGPGIDYPSLGLLGPVGALEIYGCLDDYGWCEVEAGAYRGWVSGEYLQYPYLNRRVYVIESRPSYYPIITFNFGNYWYSHYRSYPFYRDRSRYSSIHYVHPTYRDDHRWNDGRTTRWPGTWPTGSIQSRTVGSNNVVIIDKTKGSNNHDNGWHGNNRGNDNGNNRNDGRDNGDRGNGRGNRSDNNISNSEVRVADSAPAKVDNVVADNNGRGGDRSGNDDHRSGSDNDRHGGRNKGRD